MAAALAWTMMSLMLAAFVPAAVLAERFSPSITPTHLPLSNGLNVNAMLLTLDSMPPGLTATSPAYVAPTADQLADEHAAWVWIGPSPDWGSVLPLAFVASRVCEIAAANLINSEYAFFALRMFNGSVQVYEATSEVTATGVNQYRAPYWLPGVYSEMTAGANHICLLTVDGHIECRSTLHGVPIFDAMLAQMASRSAVVYTQISAASRFTCGLRTVDQLVECFGFTGTDSETPLFTMNYTSSMHYSSIAAQFDSGFCGIVAGGTGGVACYSVHATGPPETVMLTSPTLPATFVYPLWMFLDGSRVHPWNQACAMHSGGRIICGVSGLEYLVGGSLDVMSQTTAVHSVVMGASAFNQQLRWTDLLTGFESNPTVFVFEPLRFIAVDPVHGNDSTCNTVRTQYPVEFPSFIPCATLARALALIAYPHTWIQLLPGTHTAVDLGLIFGGTIIASAPPSCITPDELALLGNGSWIARMQETAASGRVATIDCAGASNCFSTMQPNIQFIGLTFTGSVRHAIVSYSANSTDANARLLPSSVAITNCVFTAMGAVLLKTHGTATINGCTITQSLQSANATFGLIELEDASLTMSGTTFSHNRFPISDSFVHSCLRSVSTLPVTVSISDSHWLNNSALSPEWKDARVPGGVALQVRVNGPLVLTVTNSSFVQQDVRCRMCNGGAVSVITGVGAVGNQIQVTFSGVHFDRNLNIIANVEPGTEQAVSGRNCGSCLAISNSDSNHETLITAADVTITGCTFQNSESMQGGCLFFGILNSLLLTQSTFENCTGAGGGSVYMGWNPDVPVGFQLPTRYDLSLLTITRSRAWGHSGGTGGGILLDAVRVLVVINNVQFSETQAIGDPMGPTFGGTGGAVQISSCSEVFIQRSRFTNASADFGGAVAVDKTTELGIRESTFNSVYAQSRGGAIVATNCDLFVQSCDFVDVGLAYHALDVDQSKVIDRVGGAVSVSGGKTTISLCSFTRVSALPNDLQLSSCAQYYDSSSGFSSIGLGGAISAEYSEVEVSYLDAHDLRACSGGLIFARFSQATVAYGISYLDVRAHSGGVAVFVSCSPAQLFSTTNAQGISAVAAGGAIVFNDCPQITVDGNHFSDVSVTNGDGGLIWINAQRRPVLAFTENVLSSVTAPAGAGAVIFVQSAPNAFQPLDSIDDSMLSNDFSGQPPFPSLYGPLIATGVAAVSANQLSLSVSAGSFLSTPLGPLRITALDSYQNSISQDRGLVVQVSCPAVEFRGTTLRRISATDGSALFSDLRVIAVPGNYTLLFSIVTAPAVSIALNLTVTADCPAASFYSSSDRSCVECASDILVYDATANACQRCPAGWQRVAANDTTGSLRDGVSCELCPLGQVSTVGSLCAPCGPNTYQPIPLSECVACSAVDGLNCVGDGLARVDAGFFAMAIGEGTDQRIHTYQCPESFCSAAEVQVATAVTGNSSSLLSSSAVNSFSQCAFPRLASPSNLLCGECAAGYRPWGNKCARCDSVDGGLLFGLLVLSLVLLAWLLRSSLGSPSAGHAVVVLYFVQTAMLELGSINELLAWLNVALLSPNSISRCVAPLSPYQQTQAQILMPVALWIELMVLALMHWAAFKRWGARATQEPAADASSPLASRARSSALRFVSQWSVDVYVSATLSLLLFTYTQVAVACVSYLRCVEVGSESVVFSQPAMRCGSDEYAQTRVLVVFALVAYVAGLPVSIAAFLWRRSASVQAAHALMSEQLRAGQSESDSASAPPSSSSPHRAVSSSPVSDPFLRRYAPLFAMYSSSAWFWQVFVLCRRTVFVTVSVLLLPTPRRRFLAFALSTLLSQLIQSYFQPFRVAFFNRAESSSHVLLLVLSVTLTSESPPYSASVDAFIFLLVVPPLALYLLYTAVYSVQRARSAKQTRLAESMQSQEAREAGLASAAMDVELHSMQSNPAAEAALRSPSAAASDEAEGADSRARL